MYTCFGWIHLPHTESTRSQTLHQLSQRRRHQHLRRFYHSALTQLTWSLTLRWLSWRGISLGVDSVDEKWDSASTESCPMLKNLNKSANSSKKSKKFRSLIIWPICIWWRQVRFHVKWVNAEWDSTSTESTQKTPTFTKILSFHVDSVDMESHSSLTQLMWSLTWRWLSWRRMRLRINWVTAEC